MSPFRIQFLLHNGFSNMVLACAMEPWRAVGDMLPGAVQWSVVTPENDQVESSSGLRISPDETLAAKDIDILVVIAGYGFRNLSGPVANSNLRRAIRQAKTIVGLDSAPWLLAEAGALDRKRTTVHWQTAAEMAEAFPRVDVTNARVEEDGAFLTAGEASGALDLMLQLIERSFGPGIAFEVSTLFVHDAGRHEHQDQGPSRLQARGSPALRNAVSLMSENIETPMPLPTLAKETGLSERSLTRLFNSELGMSPGRYYQSLRLSRARDLAAAGRYSQSEIALRTGFSSASTLSRAFSTHFGQTLSKAKGR